MEQVLLYSTIMLWLVQIVVLFSLFLIFRQFGEVYLSTSAGISRDGVAIGKKIPEFKGTSYRTNQEVTQKSLLGKRTLITFISPRCAACEDLISDWNQAYFTYKDRIHFVLIGIGDKEEYNEWLKKKPVQSELIVDHDQSLTTSFKVRVTPFALVTDEQGVVREKGLCNRGKDIIHFISAVEERVNRNV